MYKNKRVGALLLMAGEGLRMGREIPKQFLELGGKKVYEHALETLQASGLFDEIWLVCHKDWADLPYPYVVKGGKTRQESAYLGLKAFATQIDIVLIHDAVRPFVSQRMLKENVEEALAWGAANTCIPCVDTLVHAPQGAWIEQIPKRAEYLRGQTPQTFRMDWVLEAHEKALQEGFLGATDDCQLIVRLGKKIKVVPGDEMNLKITSELDLLIAHQWLGKRAVQVISTNASSGSLAT